MGVVNVKLLFVNPNVPYPPKNGGKIRTFSFLKFLSERHDVYLLAFDDKPEDRERIEALKTFCKDVIVVPLTNAQQKKNKRKQQLLSLVSRHSYQYISHYNAAMQEAIKELLAREAIDLVQIEFSQMGYYQLTQGMPCVLDEHNVEYELLERSFESSPTSIRKLYNYLEWRKFKADEIAVCNKFTRTLTTSERDKRILAKQASTTQFEVIPNGVDSDYFTPPDAPQRDADTILFTGTINYYPNTDGLAWFLENIYPRLKAKRPTIKLIIAGRDPPEQITRYTNDPSITITGFVEDIRDCFNQASLAIVPLRIGGGTRLKILEAWSMKLPVVSTSVGAEGLEYEPNESIVIADEAEAFAESIVHLLNDKALQEKLAEKGRKLAIERYDWRSVTQTLERVYENMLGKELVE